MSVTASSSTSLPDSVERPRATCRGGQQPLSAPAYLAIWGGSQRPTADEQVSWHEKTLAVGRNNELRRDTAITLQRAGDEEDYGAQWTSGEPGVQWMGGAPTAEPEGFDPSSAVAESDWLGPPAEREPGESLGTCFNRTLASRGTVGLLTLAGGALCAMKFGPVACGAAALGVAAGLALEALYGCYEPREKIQPVPCSEWPSQPHCGGASSAPESIGMPTVEEAGGGMSTGPGEEAVGSVPAPHSMIDRPSSVRSTLSVGSTGSQVQELQVMLNTAATSSPILADGVFGSGTRDAVTAFQRQNGLAADGVVGPRTWGMLEAIAGQPEAESQRPAQCWRTWCPPQGWHDLRLSAMRALFARPRWRTTFRRPTSRRSGDTACDVRFHTGDPARGSAPWAECTMKRNTALPGYREHRRVHTARHILRYQCRCQMAFVLSSVIC